MQFDIVRCDRCGLTYTSPMPTLEQLMPFYNVGIYEKDERRPLAALDRALSVFAGMRLREIEKMKQPGRLLDIGSGKGRFVSRAQARGWKAQGVEPVPETVKLARARYGIDVVEGTLIEANFPAGSFDVVTMWHVLEHVADPGTELREVSRVLAKDGLLVLEVPNLASLQARLGREQWFHLMLPHHLVHYTPRTLRAVLAGAGFDVVRISTMSPEQGPLGMVQTLLNRLGGERDFLFHRLKRMPRQSSKAAYAASIVKTGIGGPIAILPATAAELVASWAGQGSVIRVFARKS
jgi:2-polyprenyl-3-methyl-5-hydroxy-6-metoxy-1,4-benzoquinol methylase